MEIYVLSRGFSQNDDYLWLKCTPNGQEKVGGLPVVFEKEATDLIQSEVPSVFLARREKKLLLLITAIQPKGRGDFNNRQIRISVAWLLEDSTDRQRVLRMLAVRSLDEAQRKQLTQEISAAVTLGGDEGFQGNFDELSKLANSEKTQSFILDEPLDEEKIAKKLAKTSTETKMQLAEELKQYCLPEAEGPLVVATGIKKEETLKKAGVWRGLSTLVKTQEWEVYQEELEEANPSAEPLFGLPPFFGSIVDSVLTSSTTLYKKKCSSFHALIKNLMNKSR